MARENRSWGYDRIVGALANLGHTISDQTVGNILKRHGLPPAPERKTSTTWKEFIRTHMEVLVATDFFTAEVWTLGGLVTYYVLFFIHLGRPTVWFYVISLVAHTYGYDGGRIGPTHCALIDGRLGGRCSRCRVCGTPPAGARSARSVLAAASRLMSTADPGGFHRSRTTPRSGTA